MTARLVLVLLVAGAAGAQTASHFTTSGTCIACHSAIPYPSGAVRRADHPTPAMLRSAATPAQGAVGPHTLWTTSAMANAAVDPYWQARVRWQGRQHPTATAVIEDTCMHCHAPMQRCDAHAAGTGVRLSEMNALGKDGVSCTLCQQILPDRLGTKESFAAGFVIHSEKKAFGPHANPFVNPMVMQSGYTPTMAGHISESALCGSCHTVITPVLGADGSVRFSLREHGPEGAGDFRGTGNFAGWVNGESTIAGRAAGAGADGAVVAASEDAGRALLFAAVPALVPTHQDGVFLHPFRIVDAASIAPTGNSLARNSLVSLYGLRLASSNQVAEQIPLPVSLGGTRVEVNGSPAGLLMVSPGRINLQLPESLDVDDAVVQVIGEAGSSEKIRIALAPSSPGVFSVSQGGLGAGVVPHADYPLVSAVAPATSGEVVIVFLTGLGENQPPPWVTVNGQAAEVQYAGAHAVFVGLYQINIELPAFPAADNAAVLTLRTREGHSDTVTLAVAP